MEIRKNTDCFFPYSIILFLIVAPVFLSELVRIIWSSVAINRFGTGNIEYKIFTVRDFTKLFIDKKV